MSISPLKSWRRVAGACALAALFAVSNTLAGSAASLTPRLRTVAGTGLFTLNRGHTLFVNLVELGGERAQPTEVVLRVRGLDDRVLAHVRGVLAPGEPLRLTMPGPSAGAVVFRAEAVLIGSTTNFDTAPVLSVEIVNNATLDTSTGTSCAIPYDPEGTGGPVTGDCGGCQFTFTIDLEP